VIGVVFGLLVYLGIALWADGPSIFAALKEFPVKWIFAACGLSFCNYLVRFARWERYRSILGIQMASITSFRIYLAGLAFTVTPGKMGEAFRSLLIQKEDGTPLARSAPMVLAERFTDLLGFLILLAIGGIASAPDFLWVFCATLALCVFLLVLVSSDRFATLLVNLVSKLPVVGPLAVHLHEMLRSTRVLLTPKELVMPTLVSTIGWGLECFAFYLVAEALVPGAASLLFATYTFALSAILGAIMIIFPGGLGPTEASMGTLLTGSYKAAGLGAEMAAAKALTATFIIRFCTLWFAVVLGGIALALHTRLRRASA
jgi:glycosyltransferase 2 family protein